MLFNKMVVKISGNVINNQVDRFVFCKTKLSSIRCKAKNFRSI